MTILVDGKKKRIGLSLSGGGFRAAGFHLGVIRKLQELDLLWKIDLLSCVSGGSIVGAYLALRWGDDSELDDLEKYLTTKNIDIKTVFFGLLNPFKTRTEVLANCYDEDLYKNKTLGDLKNGPRIYLNATNLATGNLFFFVAGGEGEAEIGEHSKQIEKPDFSISSAVAASSAFPPVYKPLKIDRGALSIDDVCYITLTDGGVYDNLGLNPLLLERNNLDYSITSDGGKPFEINPNPVQTGAGVLKSSIGIMMEQIRGKQLKYLYWKYKAGESAKPIWLSINSTEGEQVKGDAIATSNIPTRLKALSIEEIKALKRHGGALVEARINTFSPELLVP